MNWFNEVFDLAAVASGAGLAGGGGAAVVAWAVRGAVMRFIVRTVITAALTGIGFYVLLGALGFQIVPEDEVVTTPAARGMAQMDETSDTFLPQGASPELAGEPAPADDDGKERIIVKSPFRRGG